VECVCLVRPATPALHPPLREPEAIKEVAEAVEAANVAVVDPLQPDHPDHPDSQETQEVMDNQEAPVNPVLMLHQHQLRSAEDKDVKSASQPRTALQDHPAQPEDQDNQAAQDKMLREVDPDQLDLPAHPDPLVDPETTVNPEDPDNQDRCTMFPEERDQPAHPDPMDSPVAQASQETMGNPVNQDHPVHQETMELQEHQAIREDQDPLDNPEVKEAKELATIAHLHALLLAIKPVITFISLFTITRTHSNILPYLLHIILTKLRPNGKIIEREIMKC